jgi:hypothetical protein
MSEHVKASFHRRHKLPLQGLAFGTVMLVPIALYYAAQADVDIAVLALLVAQGVGMLLAAWVG